MTNPREIKELNKYNSTSVYRSDLNYTGQWGGEIFASNIEDICWAGRGNAHQCRQTQIRIADLTYASHIVSNRDHVLLNLVSTSPPRLSTGYRRARNT